MGRWIDDPTCPSGFRYDPDGEPLGQQPATTMLPLAARDVEPDASLAGHLGTVTDQEWRDAHERLIADMPDLADQLAYTWRPDLDPRRLIRPDERDMAPRPERYDPAGDERFQGGGFRG